MPEADMRPPGTVVSLPVTRPLLLREFQPDALAIEELAPKRITRLTLYAAASLIISAVAWAAFSEVDRIVVATGSLVTTVPNLVVQPLETSVIRSVTAKVGDIVPAGAMLAILDPTFTAADVTSLKARLASRQAQIARLDAEVGNRVYTATAMASDDVKLQAASYAQRVAYRNARIQDFDARIARSEANIATAQKDRQMLAPRLETARELESIRAQLLATQTGSRINFLEARNTRLDLESTSEHLRHSLAEVEQEVHKAHAERQSFLEEFRQTALDDLIKLRTERDAITEELNKAALRQQMVQLVSPVDAVVLDVANRSIGSVVKEAEALFTLVPLNAPLEAELAIEARDIGRVTAKQNVRIKLDAFPYQEHGTASGSLRMISEGSFPKAQERGAQERNIQDQSRELVYRARVQLTDIQLRGLPEASRLIPGMAVVGEIKVGRRNVLAYFLHPLLRGFDESLREP
jgi:hemolysin D